MFGWMRHAKQGRLHVAAFEVMRANVMLADTNLIIRYVNPSLCAFLKRSEDELRKELPRFSMATLIGSNIDIFHKNPSHQRTMLAALQKTHAATIRVGSQAFDLTVNPLVSRGKRAGFVVEWADANARLLAFDYAAQIAAIGRSQPIIAFTPDGTILDANEQFLAVMGYTLDEIRGKHHQLFIDAAERDRPEYQAFWRKLAAGEYQNAQFKRIAKGGREIWIQGSYNPILDTNGKVVKVVKFATDVTDQVKFVQSVGAGLAALAQGDLEQRLDTALNPELEKVRADFNAALSTLQGSMRQMRDSAGTIRQASARLQGSSDELSSRSEQQAASVEQSSAALNEITATVRKTSEATKHAQGVATSAKSAAENASAVMSETVAAMASLEQSSAQIGQIIGTIDEIAFQTSLLALNAGVEAARAGETGRGFAVVASEVRALAKRSAEAAKEIKTLISSSEQQVGRGVGLVGQTRGALDNIIVSVKDIDAIVGEIASSASDQAASLQQVNAAVNEMSVATQKNASMAQEATAITHELAGEAVQMAGLVDQFRVDGSQAGTPDRRTFSTAA
jgi:methyl-accepting chemotaxis protein